MYLYAIQLYNRKIGNKLLLLLLLLLPLLLLLQIHHCLHRITVHYWSRLCAPV